MGRGGGGGGGGGADVQRQLDGVVRNKLIYQNLYKYIVQIYMSPLEQPLDDHFCNQTIADYLPQFGGVDYRRNYRYYIPIHVS